MNRKKATTLDIAQATGVSRATVSYVLNNTKGKTISAETRRRVLAAAARLDYTPDPFARALRMRSSHSIGLVLPNVTDPSMGPLIKGVEIEAKHRDYSLVIHDMESNEKDRRRGVVSLLERPLDGLIFAFPLDADEDIVREVERKYLSHVVVIGAKYEDSTIGSVLFDYFRGGELLAEHLYECGHRKVAVISTPALSWSRRRQRLEGTLRFFRERGLEPRMLLTKDPQTLQRALFADTREYELGYTTTLEALDAGLDCTAIIGNNDMLAVGVINALKSRGLSVPGDISLVTFGSHFISEIVQPKLTIIEQPNYDFGRSACQLLMTRLDQPESDNVQDIVYRPRLIARESTRRIE